MERRAIGGCRVPSDDVALKLGRIMLKYRPIAPKPSAAAAAQDAAVEPAEGGGRAKRSGGAKRQGGRGSGRRGRKSRKVEAVVLPDAAGYGGTAAVVTLPLMPETPERKEGSPTWSGSAASPYSLPAWGRKEGAGVVVSRRPVTATGTLVTVERVTEAWGEGLCGSAAGDEELRRWLDADDCPSFFSDAADGVTRTNAAFLRMAAGGGGGFESPSSSSSSSYSSTSWFDTVSPPAAEQEVRVCLKTQGLVPVGCAWRAFTCMASVRYSCRRRGKVSLAAPCDVWRLEDGSLAWRLDVKAALSLSIGT